MEQALTNQIYCIIRQLENECFMTKKRRANLERELSKLVKERDRYRETVKKQEDIHKKERKED